MSRLTNTTRRAIILAVLSSAMAPAALFAAKPNHNQSNHNQSNHNHAKSQSNAQPRTSNQTFKQSAPQTAKFNAAQNVVAFPNGNTGINGTGMPSKKSVLDNRLLNPNLKVVPFPNGNTGISGLGMPQKTPTPPKLTHLNRQEVMNKLGKTPKTTQALASTSTKTTKLPGNARSLNFGDIVSLPGDAAKGAGGVVDQAGKVLGGGSAPAKKDPPIGKTTGGPLTVDTTPVQHKELFKPIKKLRVTPLDPTTTTKTDPAPAPTTPPLVPAPATPPPATTTTTQTTTTQTTGGGFGGFGSVLGAVLSNLPVRGIGGGFGGGGFDDGVAMPAAEPMPVYQPAPAYQTAAAQPVVAEAGSADLVLEDARMVEDATKLAGPAYSVRFRNQGVSATAKFVVATVTSTDGEYRDDAPKAMVEVPGLASGESREVTLRLPRGEFNYLILLVDANGSVNELDKTNNSAIIEKAAL